MKLLYSTMVQLAWCLGWILLSFPAIMSAQVGVGTNTPNPNAVLDLTTTNQGLLLPRLTTVQRNTLGTALGQADKGMIVFDSTGLNLFLWDGIQWQEAGGGALDGAVNGLSVSGTDVQLGGSLTQNTNIAQGGNTFSLTGGNVGIGTTIPSYPLDVTGDANLTGILRAGGNAGSLGQVLTRTAGGMDWQNLPVPPQTGADNGLSMLGNDVVLGGTMTADTEILMDNFQLGFTGGAVGIGTATPTYPLEVVNTTSSRAIFVNNPNAGTRGIEIKADATDDIIGLSSAVSGPNSFAIEASNANGTAIFAESTAGGEGVYGASNGGSGLYGIGYGTGRGLTSSVFGARTTTSTSAEIYNTTTSTSTAVDKVGLRIDNSGTWTGVGSRNIGMWVNVAGGTLNYAALFQGGRVGIGNLDPQQDLDVAGVITSRTGYRVNNAVATAGTYLRGNGTNFVPSTIQASDLPSGIGQAWQRTGSNVTLINNLDYVGIGVATPSYPLNVNGNGIEYAGYFYGGSDAAVYAEAAATGDGIFAISNAGGHAILGQNTANGVALRGINNGAGTGVWAQNTHTGGGTALFATQSGTRTVSVNAATIENQSLSTSTGLLKRGLLVESIGIWSGSGATNVGLEVKVADATNNYAARFFGGTVGIGVNAPLYPLHVEDNGALRSIYALNQEDNAFAVYGEATGVDAVGVYGMTQSNTTGGVFGRNFSSGPGVEGLAASGGFGVLGGAAGAGIGVFGYNDFTGIGVRAASTGTGLALQSTMIGTKTTDITNAVISNTATSTGINLTRTGLSVTNSGAWNGTGSRSVGLSVDVATTSGRHRVTAQFTGGMVGIGTTDPEGRLHVQGESIAGTGTITGTNGGTVFTASGVNFVPRGSLIRPNTTTIQARVVTSTTTGTSFNLFAPLTASVGAQDFTIFQPLAHVTDHLNNSAMIVQGFTRRVGIGTLDPNFQLEVHSATPELLELVGSSNTGTYQYVNNTSTGGGRFLMGATGQTSIEGTGKWILRSATGAAGSGLNFDGTTNQFGIGMINPSQRLEVLEGMAVRRSASNTASLYFNNTTPTLLNNARWELSARAPAENDAFVLANYPAATYTPRMIVDTDGRVSIGDAFPDTRSRLNIERFANENKQLVRALASQVNTGTDWDNTAIVGIGSGVGTFGYGVGVSGIATNSAWRGAGVLASLMNATIGETTLQATGFNTYSALYATGRGIGAAITTDSGNVVFNRLNRAYSFRVGADGDANAFWVTSNGNVGIGTGSTTQKLTIAGSATLTGEYQFSTPKTRAKSYGSNHMVSEDERNYAILKNSGNVRFFAIPSTANGIVYGRIPLDIPVGATITSIVIDYLDNTTDCNITVDLIRMGANSSTIQGSFFSTGATAGVQSTTLNPTATTIDENQSYAIPVTGCENINLRFYRAKVFYTIDRLHD